MPPNGINGNGNAPSAPPGQTGNTPGQSGNTPGQSGNTPGQGGTPPPGGTGSTPGQTGITPGQNEAPTAVVLDNAIIDENVDGAVIGNLTVIDPNEQDSHTLSVDDPRFEIVNGQLKLKDGVSLDHESAEAVTVNVTATDVLGLSVTQTIIIAVNDVNEAPTAISLGNASVDENASGAVIGNVTVADVDDGDSHSFALDDGRFEIVNGQLRLKDGESLDFEVEDQVEITVTATDSGGLSTSETFAITVNDLNDVPVIGSPGLTVSEGALVTVTAADLAVADADDADSAVTVQVSGVTGGQFENTAAPGTAITQFTLADVAANSIQFVHDGGEAAPTFSVAAKDDEPGAAFGTPVAAAVNFINVNDAPVAGADAFSGTEDTPITGNVLTNDSDIEGDPLSVANAGTFATANGGTVTLQANGAFTYDPAADFNGADSYEYVLSDGTDTVTSTVTLDLEAVNDSPTIAFPDMSGGDVRVAVTYGNQGSHGAGLIVNQLNDDTYFDFTATAVHYSNADSLAELSNYDVVVHCGLYYDAMSPQYYAALRDYVEADAGGVVTTGLYGYTMRNYLSGQSRADADFVSPVAYGTVNSSFGYETNRTLLFDTGHAITDGVASATVSGWSYYSANLLDADAVSLGTNPGAFSGSFYQGYTAAYSESDGLGNRAYLGGEYAQNWDGGGALRSGAFDQLLEQGVNWAAEGGGTDEDTPLTITGITITDVDAGGDTIEVSLSVANGSLALNDTTGLSLTDGDGGDGTLSVTGSQAAINAALANGLVYTPDANFNGTDTLTVVADDLGHNGTGGPLVTTASADITVNAVNDAPVIEGVGSAVFDSFDDGTLDTTLWRTTNTNTGGSIVESGGSLQITLREHLTSQDTFVPTASQPVTVSGEFSFGLLQDTFTVVTRSDGVPFASTGEIANGLLFAVQASSGTDTGYLALLELENGRGTFQSVAPTFQIGVNTVYAFEVIDNGLNVSITLTDTAVPANTVTLSATSTLDTGSNLVSVYNRGGGIGTPVVTLDELSIENLTPASGVLQVTEDTALSSAIVASDVDGDALSFTLTTDAGNDAVALAPDGAFTYTPDADFFGTASFTVEVTDGTATVTQTINLNVTPVNDPLVVTGETITVAEDTTTGGNVLINDTVADGLDVDGDLLRVTNTSSFANPFTTASGGSLVLLADGNLSYTPDANFFGADSFDYTVTDGQRSTETATVTFDVTPVDDPLVVTGETITVAEDTTTGANFFATCSSTTRSPTGWMLTATCCG